MRTEGDTFFERNLTGVREVARAPDFQINEIHGVYDKWATALSRLPGKLLATTGASSGPIWAVKQLRFRDRTLRYLHDGGDILVVQTPFQGQGFVAPKYPVGPGYLDEPDWPAEQPNENDTFEEGWKEDWEDHRITVTPNALTLRAANGFAGAVDVVVGSREGTQSYLWFNPNETWLSVPDLNEVGVVSQEVGPSTPYSLSVSAATLGALGYGTFNMNLFVRMIRAITGNRSPTTDDVLVSSAAVPVTILNPNPVDFTLTPETILYNPVSSAGLLEANIYTITNLSPSPMTWTAELLGNPPWAVMVPNNGTIPGNGTATITVTVDTTGLVATGLETELAVTSGGLTRLAEVVIVPRYLGVVRYTATGIPNGVTPAAVAIPGAWDVWLDLIFAPIVATFDIYHTLINVAGPPPAVPNDWFIDVTIFAPPGNELVIIDDITWRRADGYPIGTATFTGAAAALGTVNIGPDVW